MQLCVVLCLNLSNKSDHIIATTIAIISSVFYYYSNECYVTICKLKYKDTIIHKNNGQNDRYN